MDDNARDKAGQEELDEWQEARRFFFSQIEETAVRYAYGAESEPPKTFPYALLSRTVQDYIEGLGGWGGSHWTYTNLYPYPLGVEAIAEKLLLYRDPEKPGIPQPRVNDDNAYLGLVIFVNGSYLQPREAAVEFWRRRGGTEDTPESLVKFTAERFQADIKAESKSAPRNRAYLLGICHRYGPRPRSVFQFSAPTIQLEYVSYPDKVLEKRLNRALRWYRTTIQGCTTSGGRPRKSTYIDAWNRIQAGECRTYREAFERHMDEIQADLSEAERRYLQDAQRYEEEFETFKRGVQRLKSRKG